MCETSKQVARRNILQVIHFLPLIDRFVLFSTNKSLLLFVIILMLNQQMNIFFLNEGI